MVEAGFTKNESFRLKFDLTDLRIFISALEGGSLTAAAARNNIVVAAVSTRLRRLETAFNLELFERTGRGIRPTAAGEMFARHARKVLDQARQTESEMDEFADGGAGRVRLLSNTNMLAEHMPAALGSFLAANPDINVSVQDRPSLEVVNLLRNGDADIGIIASSVDMTGLDRFAFVPDRLVLVVPPDWPLAGEVPFSRVLDFPMIVLQEKMALSQFLRRLANELGRRPHVRMRMDGFEGLCQMVAAGAGIGVVPETAAIRYGRHIGFRTLPIAESWADRELYLCARNAEQMPLYARKLLQHLIDYAETARSG